jgi:hypothetical protein
MKIKTPLAIFGGIILALIVLYASLFGRDICLGYLIQSGIVQSTVQSLMSPDGKVVAILRSRDAGAMGSTQYSIYIVPANMVVKDALKNHEPVFEASHLEGFRFFWSSNKELQIRYDTANIYGFRNHAYPFEPPDPNWSTYIVDIKESTYKIPDDVNWLKIKRAI